MLLVNKTVSKITMVVSIMSTVKAIVEESKGSMPEKQWYVVVKIKNSENYSKLKKRFKLLKRRQGNQREIEEIRQVL